MVKWYNNNNGLTLAELAISSVIMGVIFIGIFSASTSLKRMNESLTQQAAGEMELFPVITFIAERAMQASGSAADQAFCIEDHPAVARSNGSPDIVIDCDFTAPNALNAEPNDFTFCIKRDPVAYGDYFCFTYLEADVSGDERTLFACRGSNWRECNPYSDFPLAVLPPSTFVSGDANLTDNNPYYDPCSNTFYISLDTQGDVMRGVDIGSSSTEAVLNPVSNLSLAISPTGVSVPEPCP